MTTSGCRRCGRCCMGAVISLPGIAAGEEKESFRQWLQLHRVDVQDLHGDPDGGLSVRIPTMCTKIVEHTNNTYSCSDYDNRPKICRDFLCRIAKGEKP